LLAGGAMVIASVVTLVPPLVLVLGGARANVVPLAGRARAEPCWDTD
jgi:hypothetical protein